MSNNKFKNLYIVGGTIRDYIMNKNIHDIDIAVEASSYKELKELLMDFDCTIYVEKEEFGTIRARAGDDLYERIRFSLGGYYKDERSFPHVFDFAITRSDGEYLDGRHPEKIIPTDIHSDLLRRDFTMNAMALSLDTLMIIDDHNGISDIKRGVIKSVGNPIDRFNEDALRIVRALRFAITHDMKLDMELGNTIEVHGYRLLDNAKLSDERIREELMKMFNKDTIKSLKLLSEYRHIAEYIFENTSIWLKPTMEE
jgi:tRNA nucleotidyltransferase (CCA-adding enzyme)